MLGPFTTASHLTPIQQMSLAVLSRAACASMSTTTPTTTTTTTRDRGDRYGPMEWAQIPKRALHVSRKRTTASPIAFVVRRRDEWTQSTGSCASQSGQYPLTGQSVRSVWSVSGGHERDVTSRMSSVYSRPEHSN